MEEVARLEANPPILCYVWSQESTKEEESNSLYSSTLKLALQALCLLLPRFCADIMSHPRGCISDATTSVMQTPKPGRAWVCPEPGAGEGLEGEGRTGEKDTRRRL